MNQISCYFITVLLNVILIIVLLYGTYPLNLTHTIEKLQEKVLGFIKLDFNSSYELLLDNCNKHPLYVVWIRKFKGAVYKI